MVANHHQRALAEVEIDGAGGVGEDRGANSKPAEHAHGKNHFLRWVAFVEMHAALHRGHGNVAHFSDHKTSGVAFDGRAREAGNFAVGNSRGAGEFVGECAEAGAEHQRDFWAQFRFREDEFRGAAGAGEFIRSRRAAFERDGLIAA